MLDEGDGLKRENSHKVTKWATECFWQQERTWKRRNAAAGDSRSGAESGAISHLKGSHLLYYMGSASRTARLYSFFLPWLQNLVGNEVLVMVENSLVCEILPQLDCTGFRAKQQANTFLGKKTIVGTSLTVGLCSPCEATASLFGSLEEGSVPENFEITERKVERGVEARATVDMDVNENASTPCGSIPSFAEGESTMAGEINEEYPSPMSPFAGAKSKEIEYKRALVAEAAMKAVPAIGKDDVIFEDEWLMVVNKPRGFYSEHVFATVQSMLSSPVSSTSAIPHLHLANRLDRDTSGVLVITKCKVAAAKLTQAFTNRKVRKTYVALCAQTPPTWDQISIESGHGRSKYGAWRVYSKQDVGRRLPGGSTVRDMVTRLEVVRKSKIGNLSDQSLKTPGTNCSLASAELGDDARLEKCESNRDSLQQLENLTVILPETDPRDEQSMQFSGKNSEIVVVGSENEVKLVNSDSRLQGLEEVTVVRAFPETGRTHQIRLHCQYLGLPLCGDVKYGGPHVWQGLTYDSHVLHAESLSFDHPITCEPFHVVAPCSTWATQLEAQPFLHSI